MTSNFKVNGRGGRDNEKKVLVIKYIHRGRGYVTGAGAYFAKMPSGAGFRHVICRLYGVFRNCMEGRQKLFYWLIR